MWLSLVLAQAAVLLQVNWQKRASMSSSWKKETILAKLISIPIIHWICISAPMKKGASSFFQTITLLPLPAAFLVVVQRLILLAHYGPLILYCMSGPLNMGLKMQNSLYIKR